MLILGTLLAFGALWIAVQTRISAGVRAGMVPDSVAGFALSQQTGGEAALNEIKQMHLGDFNVQEASIASYGENNVTLWVAGAGSEDEAAALIQQMTTAIDAGNTPFTPGSVYTFNERKVYSLSDAQQLHFYFQSGRLVVWIAADDVVAETALKDAMQYYP